MLKIYLASYQSLNIPSNNNQQLRQALLQKLFSSQLIEEFDYQAIPRYPNGRPYLQDSCYDFNLSHSADFLAIAIVKANSVIDNQLGVDLELIKERSSDLTKLLSRTNPQLLNKSDLGWQDFYQDWTIREALIKLTTEQQLFHFAQPLVDYQQQTIKLNQTANNQTGVLYNWQLNLNSADYALSLATTSTDPVKLYLVTEQQIVALDETYHKFIIFN